MYSVAITGTGLYTPPNSISNEELVSSFNTYVDKFNEQNAKSIANGEINALEHSDVDFIIKASGIKSRHVVNKDGILNPDIMTPQIPERSNEELSLLAEMSVSAAHSALKQAGKTPKDIDAVIVACSNSQRAYPAVAIEVQNALGIDGFGFDMNVACSSATFGIMTASDMIKAGSAGAILVLNPEVCSGHLNFRDRDSHFIFGDVATALILERTSQDLPENSFEVISSKLKTQYSNNIRNNFGFLNRTDPSGIGKIDKLFVQNGRKVFREVTPLVAELILEHLDETGIAKDSLKRLWLHQANIHMNDMIGKKVMGREPANDEAPIILDEYANTSSAGSIIAFHKHKANFTPGDFGVICSFGAGYSIGSILVKRI
jgi:beta-ketodecanoyl-[acyl-carrier-protein] synthase